MSTSALETTLTQSNPIAVATREQIFDAFRRWGYLQAQLDPLQQYLAAQPLEELKQTGEFADQARAFYCGSIGVEFMHIPDVERRRWIQDRMETAAPVPDRQRALDHRIDPTAGRIVEQRRRARYRKSHDGDESPRSSECHGEHTGQIRGCDFFKV